ncbi:AAA family ATPase [Nonomuraea sp. NPDC050643]
MPASRLILLCGLPGAGKTTLARHLAVRALGAAVELRYLEVPMEEL